MCRGLFKKKDAPVPVAQVCPPVCAPACIPSCTPCDPCQDGVYTMPMEGYSGEGMVVPQQ